MSIHQFSDALRVTKCRRRVGRPTIRKNGAPLSDAERAKRYRQRKKRNTRQNNFEWYIPKNVAEAVRQAFGGRIDVDPASSHIANTVVKAKTYFTIEDDGLSKSWHGNVMLNPPYAGCLIIPFVDKLLEEIASGHVQQAILIVHPKTDAKWFQKAAAASACICFAKRITFWNPKHDQHYATPKSGQAFLYYGKHPQRFREAFKAFGYFYNFVG
jgi:DNA N-6-adenine-methyltransferase (Dam)